jgi:excisionase family DNA binding protein
MLETSQMGQPKELSQQSETSPAMTVREAARYLKSARAHVFSLIHSGVLPFQRMGKHFVVPREAVEKLLSHGWRQNGKQKMSESAHK